MFTVCDLFGASRATPWRNRALALVLASVCGMAGAADTAHVTAWRQGGKNPANTFFNAGEKVINSENVKRLMPSWQRALGAFYVGPVVQEDGRLYVCSNLFGLSALEAEGGSDLWLRADLPGENCQSPALDNGGLVVTRSRSNFTQPSQVFKLDKLSGATRWEAASEGFTLGFNEPAIASGHVVVSDLFSSVYAFDASDGRRLWKAETGAYNNKVAIADGRVFLTTWEDCCVETRRKVWALDAATGDMLWIAETDSTNMQYPPVVYRDKVLVGNDAGKLFALDAASGEVRWSRSLASGFISTNMAVAAGLAVVASGSSVSALDLATGTVRWTTEVPGTLSSNPVIVNGMVMGTRNTVFGHELAALDLRTGRLVIRNERIRLSGSFARLTVVDGRVLVSTNQGMLEAFRP